VEKPLGQELHLANALARDSPAISDRLERRRSVALQPVVNDVPADGTNAPADPRERVAHLPFALQRLTIQLRTGGIVRETVEVRCLVLVARGSIK